jgi:hypothetical protein
MQLKELQGDVHRAVQMGEVQKEGADQDSVLHVWYCKREDLP